MALPKDFDEMLAAVGLRLDGFKKNAADFKEAKADIAQLEKRSADAKILNSEQEDLKAKLHQKSEQLNSVVKEIVSVEARLSSTVYGKYGKKNDKLEDFGLKSWQSGGRKGPRKTA